MCCFILSVQSCLFGVYVNIEEYLQPRVAECVKDKQLYRGASLLLKSNFIRIRIQSIRIHITVSKPYTYLISDSWTIRFDKFSSDFSVARPV